MNFRALEKSESWKSPDNLFWKKVANPVYRNMQQFYFLIFMGEVIPKFRVQGGGQQEGQEKKL